MLFIQSDTKLNFNELFQGTVYSLPNSECKADENFGKYVTDANICIKSDVAKAVCDVSVPLKNQIRFPTC